MLFIFISLHMMLKITMVLDNPSFHLVNMSFPVNILLTVSIAYSCVEVHMPVSAAHSVMPGTKGL